MADIKKTARAIIFNENGEIILIKRKKYNCGVVTKEYYVFPGGHLDENETFEEAVIREIKEELGINVSIVKEAIHSYNVDLEHEEIFFECQYIKGKIGTGIGEEWTNPDIEKYGSYEIYYTSIQNMKSINVLPSDVKEFVIENYRKL